MTKQDHLDLSLDIQRVHELIQDKSTQVGHILRENRAIQEYYLLVLKNINLKLNCMEASHCSTKELEPLLYISFLMEFTLIRSDMCQIKHNLMAELNLVQKDLNGYLTAGSELLTIAKEYALVTRELENLHK